MENDPNAKLLRIFIGESDKVGGQPLYEALVFEAKKMGLSGATVLRGVMGFGANSKGALGASVDSLNAPNCCAQRNSP